MIPTVNGWLDTAHLFDYNRDFLEIGTVDDPAWKCCDIARLYQPQPQALDGESPLPPITRVS